MKNEAAFIDSITASYFQLDLKTSVTPDMEFKSNTALKLSVIFHYEKDRRKRNIKSVDEQA